MQVNGRSGIGKLPFAKDVATVSFESVPANAPRSDLKTDLGQTETPVAQRCDVRC